MNDYTTDPLPYATPHKGRGPGRPVLLAVAVTAGANAVAVAYPPAMLLLQWLGLNPFGVTFGSLGGWIGIAFLVLAGVALLASLAAAVLAACGRSGVPLSVCLAAIAVAVLLHSGLFLVQAHGRNLPWHLGLSNLLTAAPQVGLWAALALAVRPRA